MRTIKVIMIILIITKIKLMDNYQMDVMKGNILWKKVLMVAKMLILLLNRTDRKYLLEEIIVKNMGMKKIIKSMMIIN